VVGDLPSWLALARSRFMNDAIHPTTTSTPRALVVASDASKRRPLVEILSNQGLRVREADNSARALDVLTVEPFDLVIPVEDALHAGDKNLVAEVKAFDDATAVVAVVDSPELAHEALAAGAYDVFAEPVDTERLAVVVDHVAETLRLRERSAVLDRMVNGGAHLGALLTRDPHMIGVVDAIRRLARYRTPVMIVGERGTEHEEVARALHDQGRGDTPFVPVTASALTVAELRRHQSAADGGTLFIDDVTAVAADVAAALTAMLEETEVGTGHERPVRIVVGYPHPTRPSMEGGDPRTALYRHFDGAVLELLPLRKRRGDAVLVARELAAGIGRDRGRDLALAKPVEEALLSYQWPGNLDELKTVVAAAATTASGPSIEVHDLPAPLAEHAGNAGQTVTTRKLRDLEIQHLRQVLQETQGNKSRAARILGLSRWALQRKLRKHGISLENDANEQIPPSTEA
jgi:DNA-binding NtrC family response regulator